MIKNLFYAFMGIVLGGFIGRLILKLIKYPDWGFIWYWTPGDFVIFTLIEFLIFLVPFAIYLIIDKVFKIGFFSLYGVDFAIIGFLFNLCGIAISAIYVVSLMTQIGKNIKSPFINYGVWAFFVVALFFVILILYKVLKRIFTNI